MYLKDILVFIPDDKPDNVGETFDWKGVELAKGEVPVRFNFGTNIRDLLGHATMRMGKDKRVYADITLYDLPDIPQDALLGLKPAVGGVTLKRSEDVPGHITKCYLRELALSAQNSDDRISPLQQQWFEQTGKPYSIEGKVFAQGAITAEKITAAKLRPSLWRRFRAWLSRGTLREV